MGSNVTVVTTRSRDLLPQSIMSHEAATGSDHGLGAGNSGF